jgi:dihydrofolate synthase/folylpolyglutamate synthase
LNATEGPVDEVFLPLYGAHQAANAAQALAAAEAFLGMKALNPDLVREGLAGVAIPGRMEVVRRSPTVVLDAAHNPHGARAAAAAVTEAFDFNPLVGVLGAMADKDVRGLLEIWAEVMQQVVVTQVASTSRGMPADELGELAAEVFGAERVTVAPRLDDALETAVTLAESDDVGASGVLVTGSVVLVGEARALLVQQRGGEAPAASGTVDHDGDWSTEVPDAGNDDRGLVDPGLTGETVAGEVLGTTEPFDLDDDPFADDLDDPADDRYADWDADDPSVDERDDR